MRKDGPPVSLSPMQPQDFHVAIIGGGIGGLACALSLAHHSPGLHIDVYEQASRYSEIGAGVGIGVNAAKILHRVGVGAAVNAISGWRNRIHRSMRRWDDGAEIITIGADFDEGEVKQLSVHRAELLEVLLEKIRKTGIATLHTGKKCVKVEVSSVKRYLIFDLPPYLRYMIYTFHISYIIYISALISAIYLIFPTNPFPKSY